MKTIVEYSEVASVFDGNIWEDSNEAYWYEYAWSVLVDSGIVSYENELERCMIIIYALCLRDAYANYCERVFGEPNDTDKYEAVEGELNELQIGQLVGPYLDNGECLYDIEEAVQILIDNNIGCVYRALRKYLTETEIFVYMYAANYRIKKEEYFEDIDDYVELEYSVKNVDDYINTIKDNFNTILNDAHCNSSYGYEYIRLLCR